MDAKDTDERSCENLLKYAHRYRNSANYNETSSAWGASRIFVDWNEFRNEAFLDINASLSDDSIYIWDIRFPAPNGKRILATLQFDLEHPLVAPRIFIKQRIFHPNISVNGEVCLQDLKNIWTPAHTIWSLILSVQHLLSDPNPHDPINIHAAKMLHENPEEYRKFSWKYYEMLDEKWENDKTDSLTKDKQEKLLKSQYSDNENVDDEVKGFSELGDEVLIQVEEELLIQHMLEDTFTK